LDPGGQEGGIKRGAWIKKKGSRISSEKGKKSKGRRIIPRATLFKEEECNDEALLKKGYR